MKVIALGLIESEDALLLVAVANVTAGVDLQKLTADDIDVDKVSGRVRIQLPAPEILSAALDNEHTYVHTRRTGLLAQRKEDLETRARVEAERALIEAARQTWILEVAALRDPLVFGMKKLFATERSDWGFACG